MPHLGTEKQASLKLGKEQSMGIVSFSLSPPHAY